MTKILPAMDAATAKDAKAKEDPNLEEVNRNEDGRSVPEGIDLFIEREWRES